MSNTTPLKSSEKKRRIEQEKKKETATGLAIVLIVVIVIAGAAWYFVAPALTSPGQSTTTHTGTGGVTNPTLTTCISEGSLAMHIHVQLAIIINGEGVTIPSNIGIQPVCTRPVHTHDDSGLIHIESTVIYPFTVKDFFLVWGQPFDNTQILDYRVDSTHTLRMNVNGSPNTQFQNYVFQNEDEIQLVYLSTG